MSFTVADLKLPADKLAQMNKALGGTAGDTAAAAVQSLCDEAAVDVARLTTGYVLDDGSVKSFIRALTLGRAYGYIGPVPHDVQKNFESAMNELTAIAKGERKNLARVQTATASPSTGGWGSAVKINTGGAT